MKCTDLIKFEKRTDGESMTFQWNHSPVRYCPPWFMSAHGEVMAVWVIFWQGMRARQVSNFWQAVIMYLINARTSPAISCFSSVRRNLLKCLLFQCFSNLFLFDVSVTRNRRVNYVFGRLHTYAFVAFVSGWVKVEMLTTLVRLIIILIQQREIILKLKYVCR